jgi:hypothetical protein
MMVTSTLGQLSRYSFGDRRLFGIECEVEARPRGAKPYPGEPVGSFWYWIKGELICNPQEVDLLVIAFSVVMDALNGSGKRPDDRFEGLTPADKLSLVDWSKFGEDDSPEAERWSPYGRNGFQPYRIIPKDGGPWFDGWEGILSETPNADLVLWRRTDVKHVTEHSLPKQTFDKVAAEFCSWFESFRARSLLEEKAGKMGQPDSKL